MQVPDQLHASQYGFRKKRATLQLLVFLDRLFDLYDDDTHDELTVLYLDFVRALDTVPLELLLKKI